jgi:YegS/Rv2252/BmrU family lipid kinase
VIVNPNAFSGKSIKIWNKISAQFKKSEISYTTHFANHANAGKILAQNLCRNGKRHFITVGGDGTLNEVVNGIYSAAINSNEVYIVPFPVGTGNDWAHTHHYPEDFHLLFRHFCKGEFVAHDVGIVNILQEGKIVDSRYFINIAGFCFDAEVIDETTKGKSPIFASATYILKLLKVLFRYKSKLLTLKWKNEVLQKEIFTIAVGICKYNGNGMMQVPMANPFDGLFDVVVIEKISIFKVMASVGKLFSGKHIRLKEVTVFQTDSLEINAAPHVKGEVEGEMLGTGNYAVQMHHHSLNVLHI